MKSVENLVKRKKSGGRRRLSRGRRAHESDGFAAETLMGRRTVGERKPLGCSTKIFLHRVDRANVADFSSGKVVNARILSVPSNAANRDYARRGVITKGAIIETEVGKARVVSRPGQQSVLNAVLVK